MRPWNISSSSGNIAIEILIWSLIPVLILSYLPVFVGTTQHQLAVESIARHAGRALAISDVDANLLVSAVVNDIADDLNIPVSQIGYRLSCNPDCNQERSWVEIEVTSKRAKASQMAVRP